VDIHHPNKFKQGTRVQLLVSRRKDTGENSTVMKLVSYDERQFNVNMSKLRGLRQDGLRVYASASSLSEYKASRKFKEYQLNSEYEKDRFKFYRSLQKTWISCLMKCEQDKYWIFDCDTDLEVLMTKNDLDRLKMDYYRYNTKSGQHFVVKPFNPTQLRSDIKHCLMKNPLMLWSY